MRGDGKGEPRGEPMIVRPMTFLDLRFSRSGVGVLTVTGGTTERSGPLVSPMVRCYPICSHWL